MQLEAVVERLSRYGQRATYSAVGGVVGRLAIGVMRGQPKTHQNSWVVAKRDGEPADYAPAERDPRLPGKSQPIDTTQGLVQWLAEHE